jgi:uncharacterized membrane protein YbaN (DUF454 family)
VPYDVRPPTHPSIHPLIHQRNWLSMSILLVEASLHLSLAPFFPLTIHPSHHSSLSPSPLSPFTPFIDLLVACFGKKSLTFYLSHHSNYRSGYTKTHWKSTRAILRPVRWRSFLPTKGTSALSLSPTPSLSPSFFLLSSYATARFATGKDALDRDIMQSIQLFSILPRNFMDTNYPAIWDVSIPPEVAACSGHLRDRYSRRTSFFAREA